MWQKGCICLNEARDYELCLIKGIVRDVTGLHSLYDMNRTLHTSVEHMSNSEPINIISGLMACLNVSRQTGVKCLEYCVVILAVALKIVLILLWYVIDQLLSRHYAISLVGKRGYNGPGVLQFTLVFHWAGQISDTWEATADLSAFHQ